MGKRQILTALLIIGSVVALLGVGYLISFALLPTPQIVVIRITGDIWGDYATLAGEVLESVANDPTVRAVVLSISSPGGEVTASESLYFDVLRLRERKPVVASIDEMAASGAYYVASAADQIFSKPTSAVGNIGAISLLPNPDMVSETLITTGPFKLSGGPQVEYIRQMEMMKRTFLAAVQAQRSGRLKVGDDVLSRGEIYTGLQAQQMGLIDQIGSQTDAVSAAATMARLRHYHVVDRTPGASEEEGSDEGAVGVATSASLAASPEVLPPGFYYRYVQPLQ